MSWAIDTVSLRPYNFTRCFYRTEVDDKTGQLRMLDYRYGFNVSDNGPMTKLDLQALDAAAYNEAVKRLQHRSCGMGQPCVVHRYFIAPDHPFQVGGLRAPAHALAVVSVCFDTCMATVAGGVRLYTPKGFQVMLQVADGATGSCTHLARCWCWLMQGMWIATAAQLRRFMQQPIWRKEGALALDTRSYLHIDGIRNDDDWGYPECSASIAVLGGLVEVPQHRPSAPSSCMVPFLRENNGRAITAELARVDHLRNAYSDFGNILLKDGIVAPPPPTLP